MFRYLSIAVLTITASIFSFADQFQLDPVHSFVYFQAGHAGLGYVYGRFNTVSGTFQFSDDTARQLTTVSAQVTTDSIDTNTKQRDDDLKSAHYLDATTYPTISFTSNTVKVDGGGNFVLGGTLSLHGVTKTIAVTLKKRAEGNSPFGDYRLGLSGTLVVKRSDYGITADLLPVDDEVLLNMSFEGVRQ